VSLSPLDLDTIRSSAMKTGHLIVVDNAWISCGAGAEIIARLVEDGCHRNLKVRRMGFAAVPCPTSPPLEREFYPDAGKIAVAAFEMLNPKRKWEPESTLPPEEVAFKGPF